MRKKIAAALSIPRFSSKFEADCGIRLNFALTG